MLALARSRLKKARSPTNPLPTSQGFTDLVPHNPKALLSSLHIANDTSLLLLYSVDVKDELYLHDLPTGQRVKRLGADLLGSIDSFSGRREHKEFWFSMTSFTSPGTVHRYDFTAEEGNERSIYREATVAGIKPQDFESTQVFYTSKDGTKVPMFITRPAGCVCLSPFFGAGLGN